MITSTLIALTCAAMVIAFLVCGIPFGLIIAARLDHLDVRTVGSGNIGTTNVARSAGAKAGVLTLACDVGKGLVATLVGRLVVACLALGGNFAIIEPSAALGWTMAFVYLAAILGHVYSPYLHFHGGKGIAVGFGAALGFMWPVALGMLLVFVVFAVPTRYVSLGSTTAAVSLPLWAYFLYHPTPAFLVALVIVAVVVIWAHHANIGKLIHGEERKFSFHHAERPADEGKGTK